jgi:hypothetical protein
MGQKHPQDILSRGCFLFAHIPHPDALQPFCARSRPFRRTGASARGRQVGDHLRLSIADGVSKLALTFLLAARGARHPEPVQVEIRRQDGLLVSRIDRQPERCQLRGQAHQHHGG